MSDILGTAVSGLNASGARIANIASNIVKASSKTTTDAAETTTVSDSSSDLAGNLVALSSETATYDANAALVKTAGKLHKTLLDTLA